MGGEGEAVRRGGGGGSARRRGEGGQRGGWEPFTFIVKHYANDETVWDNDGFSVTAGERERGVKRAKVGEAPIFVHSSIHSFTILFIYLTSFCFFSMDINNSFIFKSKCWGEDDSIRPCVST